MTLARISMSFVVLLCAFRPAEADPVRITSGTIFLEGGPENSSVFLQAEELLITFNGTLDPGILCPAPCSPGDLVDLSQVNRDTVAFLSSPTQQSVRGTLAFDIAAGVVPIPTFNGPAGSFSSFSFSGVFTSDPNGGAVQLQLFGAGKAGVFQVSPAAPPTVLYAFEAEPVPEPATVVLVGSGLAGAAMRRRWRRFHSSSVTPSN